MRLLLPLLTCALLLSPQVHAQATNSPFLGAWESSFIDGNGNQSMLTMIVADDFMSMAAYNEKTGAFIATLGGRWNADANNFNLTYEYDSSDSTQVGTTVAMPYTLTGNVLVFNQDKVWTRVDDTTPGALAGAWEIIGRKRDGVMQDLSYRRTSPRKTMKILSGSRFQWIAFDLEKKQFRATGGGEYTTNENGLYVEKITFFSRDASRAGSSLSFDYLLFKGDWVHKGLSSKGNPIHEVWSLRQ